ncbi:MAG: Asparagine synthase [Methanomicrobiales archaeon 53_19]|nr:MAG: Asparagine synthase [Methanomicrobiales archaeon 53_19]
MATSLSIRGWVEEGDLLLTDDQIRFILDEEPERVCRFGGEFAIEYGAYRLRDFLGVVPGNVPPGTFQKNGETLCRIVPDPPEMPLEDAIREAVSLRKSEKSVVAIGCDLIRVEIDPSRVEPVLRQILSLLPSINPVDASIATTAFFLCEAAADQGYDRIISGQGADELFCGYTRYLESSDLKADRTADIADLPRQLARDQAVAGLFDIWISLPYLDTRVVRAADQIPVGEMIQSGVRKFPLRRIASAYLPEDIAWYEKKAMQYGSGVWKAIRDHARERGFKRAVQGYMNYIEDGRAEHGI